MMKNVSKKTGLTILMALGLAIGIFAQEIFAQEITVSGTVTDAAKDPLTGVSVVVKGTNTGTVTDIEGHYSLKTSTGKTLVFSYPGFVTQEIKVTKSLHNVQLKEDAVQLESMEVVGIGQGNTRRADLSGYVSDKMAAPAMEMEELSEIAYVAPQIAADKSYVVSQDMSRQNYYDQAGTEEYNTYKENRFLGAKDQPLSTFGLDVNTASYGNVRRIINQGQIPPRDAVRIEEMINYFAYEYANPTGKHPVNIMTETAVCPWNAKHQIVRIGVKAKDVPNEQLPPANLVFLIDVSGSMQSANRLPLVKTSMKILLNSLRAKDRVAIVTYANNTNEVLQSTPASDKQIILDAIDKLYASGGTNGGDGIQRAYKMAEKNFAKDGNNRIVLCTDGDFNIGISSPQELENLIEAKRKTGIFLTVLGYGMGNYKDNRLQILSEKGNGNYAYIENIQEANKVLVNEFGGTMYTVAKDAKIQVEFNPAYVNAYRLVGYESRMLNKEDFNDDSKDAGDLGAGHTVTALYEIIPVGVDNHFGGVDKLKYQVERSIDVVRNVFTASNNNELLTVKLRYKQPNSDTSERIEVPVLTSEIDKQSSKDFQFAMSVAMFGQLLKESDFKGNATYQDVLKLAKAGIGKDEHGYQKEFIRLVESVGQMTK